MLIRCCSDLHLEFGPVDLPVLHNEKDMVLVLAGDIGLADKPHTFTDFVTEVCNRHKEVIYVFGNHEFYHTSLLRAHDKVRDALKDVPNLHVVDNEIVLIENVNFICSTMWASMDNANPITLYEAGTWMNDYKQIRTGPSIHDPYKQKLRPENTVRKFREAVFFIFDSIKSSKQEGKKVVVVTHHAPSFMSIAQHRKESSWSKLNGAYASHLEEDILDTQPNVWIHGHTHDSHDYMIGETRVVCNPRGYYLSDENEDFIPELTITV